jgi:hypothetical protein
MYYWAHFYRSDNGKYVCSGPISKLRLELMRGHNDTGFIILLASSTEYDFDFDLWRG